LAVTEDGHFSGVEAHVPELVPQRASHPREHARTCAGASGRAGVCWRMINIIICTKRARGSAGSDGLAISYLTQAERLRCIVMPEQIVSRQEAGEKNDKGLTPEQRRHLERSLKENDDLMKCLAKM